jgi:hypothetical protein
MFKHIQPGIFLSFVLALLPYDSSFAQYSIHHFDMIVGSRIQKERLGKSPVIIGLGKGFLLNGHEGLLYAKSEMNLTGWRTIGAGVIIEFFRKNPKQTPGLFADFYIPVQNMIHKEQQNISPISGKIGVNFPTANGDKFIVAWGMSEDWKSFFELGYRVKFTLKTKVSRRRSLRCPEF